MPLGEQVLLCIEARSAAFQHYDHGRRDSSGEPEGVFRGKSGGRQKMLKIGRRTPTFAPKLASFFSRARPLPVGATRSLEFI
jgi:hypothetical protein